MARFSRRRKGWRMKKTTSFLLSLILAISLAVPALAASSYTDVPDDAWAAYADTMYAADVKYDLSGEELDLAGLKAARKDSVDGAKRVQINNILVSEDWAAIHFWDVTTAADGEKSADNHMQFLHFVPDGDGVKVDMCWAK